MIRIRRPGLSASGPAQEQLPIRTSCGQGAHVRASRGRSGALGSPRSARVGFGAQPRLIKTSVGRRRELFIPSIGIIHQTPISAASAGGVRLSAVG